MSHSAVVAEPMNPSASHLSLETRMCSSLEKDENGERKGQDSAQTFGFLRVKPQLVTNFLKLKSIYF